MRIRILSIVPIYWIRPEMRLKAMYLERKKDPETEIIRRFVDKGTAIIASRSDRIIAGYHVVKEALRATKEVDFDAVFVRCFADPGVVELRELLDVPVLGPYQACVHVASFLGRQFSIVTVSHYGAQTMKDLAAYYGVNEKLASIRHLKITPLELGERIKDQNITEEFVKIAQRCIEEDDADVILPGCGYFRQIVDDVRKDLDAVVLDPIETPIRMLELLVKMGVKPSKKVFPAPTEEHLKQYRL